MDRDFAKFPGDIEISDDGTQVKTLPNGTKVVRRQAKGGQAPTLEIQPKVGPDKIDNKIRIKIRYPSE